MRQDIRTLKLLYAKVQGKGEDAPPFIDSADGVIVLAVFDGMGGAGSSQRIDELGIIRTDAYVAAHIAQTTLAKCWKQFSQVGRREFAKLLEGELQKALHPEAKTASNLTGRLLRRLPTTLSCAFIYQERDPRHVNISAMWAGDSRAYVLSPHFGLLQISTDDTDPQGDALQNLLSGAPLANFVSPDIPFHINVRSGPLELPLIVFVCSDGCFDFLPTPMHFEYLLLSSVVDSNSFEQWQTTLENYIFPYATDDVSMACTALGWQEYSELRQSFQSRQTQIYDEYIRHFDEKEQKVLQTEESLIYVKLNRDKAIQERNELRESLWAKYKQGYEILILK